MKAFLAVLMFISFNNILNSQIILTVDDLPKSGDVQVSARIYSLENLTLSKGNLKNGLYYFQLINDKGNVNSGKFIIN